MTIFEALTLGIAIFAIFTSYRAVRISRQANKYLRREHIDKIMPRFDIWEDSTVIKSPLNFKLRNAGQGIASEIYFQWENMSAVKGKTICAPNDYLRLKFLKIDQGIEAAKKAFVEEGTFKIPGQKEVRIINNRIFFSDEMGTKYYQEISQNIIHTNLKDRTGWDWTNDISYPVLNINQERFS